MCRRSVVDQIRAGAELPFGRTPAGDDFDVRIQGVCGQFEADLVVAFAGRAVADVFGAFGLRDIDKMLRDERAGDGCAEEVHVLVDGVGLEHREDVVFRELFRQVFDVGFDGAGGVRFFMQPVQFLFLPDVRAVGDDFGVVCLLQPLEDAGRVQTAGICEYDFHDVSPCVG